MSFPAETNGPGRAKARAGLPGSPTRNPRRSSRLDPPHGVTGWSLLSIAPTVAFATAIRTETILVRLAASRELQGAGSNAGPICVAGLPKHLAWFDWVCTPIKPCPSSPRNHSARCGGVRRSRGRSSGREHLGRPFGLLVIEGAAEAPAVDEVVAVEDRPWETPEFAAGRGVRCFADEFDNPVEGILEAWVRARRRSLFCWT